MDVNLFLEKVQALGIDFFAGVPDSLLSPLCDALYMRYGSSGKHHVVAANEGGAVGLAAGHYIATGKPALVYMQNSGIGNTVNPIASLLHEQVYGIPCLFVVGWRGEPGVHDEPQHKFQGTVTVEMMELLGVKTFVLDKNTDALSIDACFAECAELLNSGRCAAIVVKKGALTNSAKAAYCNDFSMTRERALEIILDASSDGDVFVSTTGKVSRELFELRESRGEGHSRDFLTVGSMGHASMIAAGIATARPERRVWCIDGDGAAMMHLGSLAVAAGLGCDNLVHIVMNNGAHESVGGMPVAGSPANLGAVASAAGYRNVFAADSEKSLEHALREMLNRDGTRFIEIKVALGSRPDLGRPTTTPQENLSALRGYLK